VYGYDGGVGRGESVEGQLSPLEVSLTSVESDVVKALDGCRAREDKWVKLISRCLYINSVDREEIRKRGRRLTVVRWWRPRQVPRSVDHPVGANAQHRLEDESTSVDPVSDEVRARSCEVGGRHGERECVGWVSLTGGRGKRWPSVKSARRARDDLLRIAGGREVARVIELELGGLWWMVEREGKCERTVGQEVRKSGALFVRGV
jgi:hypothetical protein